MTTKVFCDQCGEPYGAETAISIGTYRTKVEDRRFKIDLCDECHKRLSDAISLIIPKRR